VCTVSIIPIASGFRLVVNRDESRRREPASPPVWRRVGPQAVRAIWPLDRAAGGTWVGANEFGVVLAVLNLNPHPPVDIAGVEDLVSRGMVIPRLLDAPDAARAARALGGLRLDRFAPFRMLAIDPGAHAAGRPGVIEATWDRSRLVLADSRPVPACFVSSGLGDVHALPRLDVFRTHVLDRGPTPEAQDEFHRHQWPGRPEVSVLMARADARTVSRTSVEVQAEPAGPARVSMRYDPLDADDPASPPSQAPGTPVVPGRPPADATAPLPGATRYS